MKREKKTIVHILNTGEFSGAENVVISIIKEFQNKDDYEMIYVSLAGNIESRLKKEKIKFEPIKKISIREINRVVRKYRPHIIHAHDFTASIVCACVAVNTPVISHIHNNPPWLKTFNIRSMAYAASCIKYKYMLGVSQSVFSEYIFGKLFRKKEKIIGNPISIKAIQEKALEANNKDAYDIVFLGRLTTPKNPIKFVEIVSEVNKKYPVKAVMLGEGDLKPDIINRIKELKLNNIIDLRGFIENPYGILKESKILCMPSVWEGFGLAAVEALAVGTPVIAARVGGLPGFIDDSCGAICDLKEEYIEKIVLMLQRKNVYDEKVIGAYRKAKRLDNMDTYIKQIEQIYYKIGRE